MSKLDDENEIAASVLALTLSKAAEEVAPLMAEAFPTVDRLAVARRAIELLTNGLSLAAKNRQQEQRETMS